MGVLREYEIHEKLSLVEACLDIGQEQAVPLIKQAHAFVDSRADDTVFTLFDAPPGASCPVIEATRNADRVILVTEPTPFGLHDLRVIVETMKELNVPVSVVINRHGIGNEEVTDYCRHEGVEIIAKIPADRRIAELYSAGELVYRTVPEFREALEKIQGHIVSEKEGEGAV
jgi:MinD superfamily P-loop ATPase